MTETLNEKMLGLFYFMLGIIIHHENMFWIPACQFSKRHIGSHFKHARIDGKEKKFLNEDEK